MHFPLVRAAAIIGAVLLRVTGVAHGGGLIDVLPRDGSWARYDMTTTKVLTTGKESKRQETVTVSSVGTKDVNGRACRWIEIAHGGIYRPVQTELKQVTDIDTFLIPEATFSTEADPFTHASEIWRQASDFRTGVATRLSKRDQQQARHIQLDLRQFIHGKPKDVRDLPMKVVESKIGTRECAGTGYEDSFTLPGGMRYELKIEVWRHKDAPFGVVEMNIDRKEFRDDELQVSYLSKLILSDYGDGAEGKIKDAK